MISLPAQTPDRFNRRAIWKEEKLGNLLLRILVAMAVFVGIVLLIGTLIPRGFTTSSSVVIDVPADKIFPYINKIKLWSEWTTWNEHQIADLEVHYSGAEAGVGAIQEWTEPRGDGKLWITESLLNQQVGFSSLFANFPNMDSTIKLTQVDGGTRVTWESTGALPSGPFYGWFGLTFSDALQREYSKSLETLKRICEARQP